ncbi:MAG: translocation/assembly module TamB domain-containing protein [Gemmatimonadaceae bacterium]
MKRVLVGLGIVIGAIAVLLIAGVLVFTMTDFGHERLRRFTVRTLGEMVHGQVRIGGISGNLLDGVVLTDFLIADTAGRPFISADTVFADYRLVAFAKKRIELHRLRLVRPLVIFDKLEDEDWNWESIFPEDTTPDAPNEAPGFGDWVAFDDIEVIEGRFIVRTPWKPDDDLAGAARQRAIADALAGGTRQHVVRARKGFQQVMDFRQINAEFPRLRLESPDSSGVAIHVTALSGIAAMFRPPVAEIRDVEGKFYVIRDTLRFDDARIVLAGSEIVGDGTYQIETQELRLALRGEPVALADLRWLYPRLPSEGRGTLDFSMVMRDEGPSDYVARNATIQSGSSRIGGDFGLILTETDARFHDTRLTFSTFDTRLIEQLVPGLHLPRRGTLGGRASLAGTMREMTVDGDVAFDDAQNGRSRIVATGVVGFGGGDVRARDLRVRLAPLQVDLARIAMPDLPVGGVVTGTATLEGSTTTRLTAHANLEHVDRRAPGAPARSHLTGRGVVTMRGTTWMDLDLRAQPLSLVTVGRFAPGLGLRGSAAGPIRVRGSLNDLAVQSDLRLPDGGELRVAARVDVQGTPSYDARATVAVFNLNRVAEALPRTSLSGVATVRGAGSDPSTMRANITADFRGSAIDSVSFDSARVRVAIADGMASVQPVVVHTSFARVDVGGTFGLAAGRDGELSYHVRIDSMAGLARWLPTHDTSIVEPRPGRMAKAIRQAREDSARIARVTEVEREVMGAPAPMLKVDSLPVVRKDSLAGSLIAAGTIRGNITRFDVRGRAAVENLAISGYTVRRGRMEYGWLAARTPQSTLALGASLDTVQAAGFALDSVEARITAQGSTGTMDIAIHQHESHDYRLAGMFAFHPQHDELHLDRLRMRFDTTTWMSARPSAIRWGERGIQIVALDLRSGTTGRIFVNGTLPTNGSARLDIAINGLEVSHVAELLQSDIEASGVVQVVARVEGTTSDPRVRAALGLTSASYRGTVIPDLRSRLTYANAQLDAYAAALRGNGAPVAVAEGVIPVNLALSGVTGPRLLDRPLSFELRADSLPLDVLPKFTDAVSEVRGKVVGVLTARGTARSPQMTGLLAMDFASFRIVPLGVRMHDINGLVRLTGDTIVIDSLVGYSRGPIRVRGGIGVAELTRPAFDLRIVATDARVLDNDNGRLDADANIGIEGPFESVYVTGTANIRDGVIYIPRSEGKELISADDPAVFAVIDTSVVSDREILPAQSSLLQNLRMDVSLNVSRDTWVRSSEANVEVYTPERYGALTIHVDRARQALTLEGVVNADRGTYEFMGRRFVINRGSATFIGDPELNPMLQITAVHEVQLVGTGAMDIQVLIGGTLQSPKLTLESTSQPPISQSDLLSYLAFGRSSSSLLQVQGSALSGQSSGSGELVGAVASIATRQLAGIALDVLTSELEQDAARSLGTDVFNVTPADVPPELSTNSVINSLSLTEVEAGKYVNRSRTFVAVQAQPANKNPFGIRLQHRMPNGMRLELSYVPRYLVREPTLAEQADPPRKNIFGAFLIKEWRF